MKKVNVLILDDNFIIANKLKKRLFDADNHYKFNTGIQIFPHYIEIDNIDYKKSVKDVNNYIIENSISYLLLDRSFGKILDGDEYNNDELKKGIIYKDNDVGGYYIEALLQELLRIRNNALNRIKGIIIYTYDDYRTDKKEGEAIKEEIIEKFANLQIRRTNIDVLLSYSTIYKIAGVNLYEDLSRRGITKLGKKDNFVLYGLFCGELLYHKLIQMINNRNLVRIKNRKFNLFYKLIALFLIFTSINLGANGLYYYLFRSGGISLIFLSFLFAFLVPIIILLLKPEFLIDLEK